MSGGNTAISAGVPAAAFLARLARHRRVWRRGLALHLVLRLAGWTAAGLALYGLFDYFIPVAAPLRRWINSAGVIVLAGGALCEWRRMVRLSLHDTACRLDRLSHNRRRSTRTACELLHQGTASQGLYAFLLARSVNEADEKLAKLPLSISLPSGTLRHQVRAFGLQLAILLALVALNPFASRVILMRILRPAQDAPPYSRYVFHIDPVEARVTYGGSIELNARITGAPLRAPVWLLTRDSARTHRTACFQEADDQFSQRLDHVVAPLEFAFATERARSAWHPIRLLLQPRVAGATVAITPLYTAVCRHASLKWAASHCRDCAVRASASP